MASDFDPYHRWLGIPPEEQPPDHYRLLGVSRFESDREVISNASDQRMTHLRTFAAGKRSADSQRLLNEVSAATHCLLDAAKKTHYDAQLRTTFDAKASQSSKALPVAVALPTTPDLAQRRPLPVQPVPLQPSGIHQTGMAATAYAVASPAASTNFAPQVAPRRPARRSKNSGFTFTLLGLIIVVLVGAGAIYAFRISRDVAPKPDDPGQAKRVKPVERVSPSDLGKAKPATKDGNKAATKGTSNAPAALAAEERKAWHYERSPEGARGVVYHVRGNLWTEVTSDGRSNEFVELEKTDAAVSLLDASRKLRIWLKPDQMTFSRNGRPETFCMQGKWVAASEVAPLLASLATKQDTKPPEETPSGMVKVYQINDGVQAQLKTPRGALDSGKPFTVEFWYHREDDLTASAGLLQMGDLSLLIKKENKDDQERTFCQLYSSASGTGWNAKGELLLDRDWHHLALCSDGAKVDVYHDGKPVLGTSLTSLEVNTLDPIAFGSAQSDQGPTSFQGEIKSVQVVDQAKYRGGQVFTSPAVEADRLPPLASLTLSKRKGSTTESMPEAPMLSDLLRPMSEPRPKTDRIAPPEGESLKAAQAAVAGVYGERARMAQKPEDKQNLAVELLDAATTDREAARSYALLMEARRLATSAMDVALGIEIINEMDSRFDVQRVDLLEKLLASLEKRPQLPPPQREVLIDEALAGTHEALKQDRVAVADSLAVLATRSASKGMDLEKKRYALALREHVAAVKSAWEAMQSGLEKLKSSPDNPAAHLAVGRYLAFANGDFKKGCEHLAKGSDAAIAEAAKQQLAVKDDLDELAAADAWNSLLPSLKSPAERLQLQRHILQVCEELKSRLTGLELGNATQHISRLLPIIAEADKYSVSLRRTSTKPAPGLIVRIFASRISARTATPFVTVAKDEQDLARLGVTNLLRPYGGRARYLLSGAVVVANDMQVRLRFEECSVAVLNETQVATSGRPIDQVIMLKKGTYPIRIESTGFGFGFEVTNLETAESLLCHPPAELEAELARPGFDISGAAIKSQRVN